MNLITGPVMRKVVIARFWNTASSRAKSSRGEVIPCSARSAFKASAASLEMTVLLPSLVRLKRASSLASPKRAWNHALSLNLHVAFGASSPAKSSNAETKKLTTSASSEGDKGVPSSGTSSSKSIASSLKAFASALLMGSINAIVLPLDPSNSAPSQLSKASSSA
jgi:hypothetical protein